METTPDIPIKIDSRVFAGKSLLENEIIVPANGQNLSNTTASANYAICAPFPPCNPLGCDSITAPIDCDSCNSTSVAFVILGMSMLAMLIVFSNILVIVIIKRNEVLRQRYGYIKVSLAVSDLLIGLFVIPAGIFNLTTSLYLPREQAVQGQNAAAEFVQTNSVVSVIFGTILVISVTTSVYNLLLLSLDRFLAVTFPLQCRSGKYFSPSTLKISITVVWVFGLLLSSLPGFIPSVLAYGLDPTTFFYIQTTAYHVAEGQGFRPIALFSLFVLGIPYFTVVILDVSAMVVTIKKLKIRRRQSSRGPSKSLKRDAAKRMEMILKNCPEMKYNEPKSFSLWSICCFGNKSKFDNIYKHRQKHDKSSAAKTGNKEENSAKIYNSRVLKMITTMVVSFTVCIWPYVIVNIMLGNGSLHCKNVGVVYNLAVYLLLIHSASNFFIYNFWHKEFRIRLYSTITARSQTHFLPTEGAKKKPNLPHGSNPHRSSEHIFTGSRDRPSSRQIRESERFLSCYDSVKKEDTRL